MPKSRNRKLTSAQRKASGKLRVYARTLHNILLGRLRGDLSAEQAQGFRAIALANLHGARITADDLNEPAPPAEEQAA
jgi:hypothetical protein